MAYNLTPQGGNADLAGRTVTTQDGYTVTYDSSGFARQSVAPDGGMLYFDSLGNQVSSAADIQAAQAATANAQLSLDSPIASNSEDVVDSVTVDTEPSTQALEDGTTVQIFDDGSTETTYPDGTTSTSELPNDLAGQIEDATIGVPDEQIDAGFDESAFIQTVNDMESGKSDDTSDSARGSTTGGRGNEANVPFGAQRSVPAAAEAKWSEAKDLRAKLRVPNAYLTGPSAGPANIIQKNGGILFPYTPQISLDNQATYSNQNPLHSNFPLYFYKNSTVGPIQVTAKFTVQNEFEGAVLLGVIHLLRSLTKMKWGNDPDAGSPPPVCRFDAYGDYMLYNIPVAVASWRHELPDGVDYIAVGRPGSPGIYGHSMVPTLSTISLTLNVMYSRREMLRYNVKDWLSKGLDYRGYL